ncbi:MAG: hypothetical protein II077_12670 [Treponema sp.]|nr:hypothetical protein [Treponema sp.]
MDSPHLRNGIQQFMGEAHEAACCALCLIDVAQEYRDAHGQGSIDVMEALYKACDKGYIYLNWKNLNDNDNFYVQYPALFLEQMTGKKWDYRHEGATYQPKKGEYLIQRYERKKTGYTIGHFQRDGLFEPIEGSLTVQYGKLVSTRVCRVIN